MEAIIDNSTHYTITPYSDQKLLSFTLDWSRHATGSGVWVLNTQVLLDDYYISDIKELLITEQCNSMYYQYKSVWWENTKFLIKQLSIDYCSLRWQDERNVKHDVMTSFEAELKREKYDILKIKELQGMLDVIMT